MFRKNSTWFYKFLKINYILIFSLSNKSLKECQEYYIFF